MFKGLIIAKKQALRKLFSYIKKESITGNNPAQTDQEASSL